ncbi:MAG: flagellar basal-body rod protein FlgG [Armatimonadota bacterium]|nr:flagellar basal-body rod protein FlgG [bacterium]
MIRALYTAATGMEAQQLNIDVTANNLANVNTTGFKKSRVDFQDLLYQNIRSAGASQAQGVQVPTGIQVGLGTRMAAVQKIFTQGDYKQTDNDLDVVIEGDGFFQVMQPSGEMAYTRDGSFKVDGQGRLVNSDGYPVQPEITIPAEAEDITIGEDGTVTVTVAGQSAPQQLGQFQLVKFINPAGLTNLGRNVMSPTEASGEPITASPGQDGVGTLRQGAVEMSNVKVVDEMVNMIEAQRAYEINSKSIQTADDMLNIANNLRR